MKQTFNKWKKITILLTIAIFAVGIFQISGIGTKKVSANNTPQTLPFTQNWTNVGLISADDDWSAVPGIIGYRGDDLNVTIGADLQTVLANGSATPIDVNANRSDPDVFATGGIAEFDGIPNPVVAFQGSATSDVPHLVIHLNTTGQSNITVAFNARDIDNGIGVDAAQQVNTQFRVGGTGDYQNVTGGYIADASSPGGATQVTPVSVTLPASANNQALVEVRIMTINTVGSDEFIGIDDISITAGPAVVTADAPVDFNNDGRTDYAVLRNVGGGASGQLRWFYNLNNSANPTVAYDWGLASDRIITEDFDNDNKDDISIWRPGVAGVAAFYILNSATNTARVETFGQDGDDPTIVDDYNGDGSADLAVYRSGANPGNQSIWFYRTTPNGATTYITWGLNGDLPAPGDYDGNGSADFVIQRNGGGGQARFWTRLSTGAVSTILFGTPTDFIVPGDYDGDGKTDLATVRGVGSVLQWQYLSSANGSVNFITFGTSATDLTAQGDYDGDGKTDVGIWRPSATANQSAFYTRSTGSGAVSIFAFGANGDYPIANYNRH